MLLCIHWNSNNWSSLMTFVPSVRRANSHCPPRTRCDKSSVQHTCSTPPYFQARKSSAIQTIRGRNPRSILQALRLCVQTVHWSAEIWCSLVTLEIRDHHLKIKRGSPSEVRNSMLDIIRHAIDKFSLLSILNRQPESYTQLAAMKRCLRGRQSFYTVC